MEIDTNLRKKSPPPAMAVYMAPRTDFDLRSCRTARFRQSVRMRLTDSIIFITKALSKLAEI